MTEKQGRSQPRESRLNKSGWMVDDASVTDLSKTGHGSVKVQAGTEILDGNLYMPENAQGLVVFVHGSGSSRNSPRNRYVAGELQAAGLATLLFDLLTPEEEEIDLRTGHLRFDIGLLARRTIAAADWLIEQPYATNLKLGFFGASTGAAAALITSAERPEITGAVVSRGGRPDLAISALPHVLAPTLMIVGQIDEQVIQLNEQALAQMNPDTKKEMIIVPSATHLFEEPGALEYVARLATDWFRRFLRNEAEASNKG
jgi:dienelactone hydrolase